MILSTVLTKKRIIKGNFEQLCRSCIVKMGRLSCKVITSIKVIICIVIVIRAYCTFCSWCKSNSSFCNDRIVIVFNVGEKYFMKYNTFEYKIMLTLKFWKTCFIFSQDLEKRGNHHKDLHLRSILTLQILFTLINLICLFMFCKQNIRLVNIVFQYQSHVKCKQKRNHSNNLRVRTI